MYVKCIIDANGFIWRGCVFCNFVQPPQKQIWKSWLSIFFSSKGVLLGMVSTSFCSGRHVAFCLSLHSHRCGLGVENVGSKENPEIQFAEDVGGGYRYVSVVFWWWVFKCVLYSHLFGGKTIWLTNMFSDGLRPPTRYVFLNHWDIPSSQMILFHGPVQQIPFSR